MHVKDIRVLRFIYHSALNKNCRIILLLPYTYMSETSVLLIHVVVLFSVFIVCNKKCLQAMKMLLIKNYFKSLNVSHSTVLLSAYGYWKKVHYFSDILSCQIIIILEKGHPCIEKEQGVCCILILINAGGYRKIFDVLNKLYSICM